MTGYTPEPWQNTPHPLGPGQPYPVPDPVAARPPEPVLVAIGDISVTATRVVTPSGTAPLAQCRFHYTDMSRTSDTIPPWAIVLAVVFALLCLLGLLFLLVKEQRTEGAVQVVVQGPGLLHTAYLPVWSPYQVADYGARVNHARGLAMGAGH
jgi:hypothetical protein